MTWTGGRRQGWITRKATEYQSGSTAPARTSQPILPAPKRAPLVVPAFPSFSPAAVAQFLGVYRSTVQYWIQAGKLEHYRDNINESYVLRPELIRFIREYLQRPVLEQGPPGDHR